MLYDLHMHSCLSPCAEDDMTPANIAGLAKLAGAELIAVTDHNAADNLPAVQCCCNAYGLRLLPGVEVNTAEEIHVLCYFKTVDTALEFGRLLYAALPEFPYDPAVWGRQLVMDENDEVLRTVDKLLTGAVSMDIYEVKAACEALGGVAVPAHVEKDSYALLSVLGFLPEDLPFAAVELHDASRLGGLMEKLYGQLPDCDNMPLYEKALEKADPKVLDEIDTLEQEYDRVCEKNADLWDKVDEAYFDLPDDYDFDNYDEVAFIRSLSFLSDAEKDALIADYNRLVELDNQLCKLYDTIWGDTGCESGSCPL